MRNNFPFTKGGPTQSQNSGQVNSVLMIYNCRDGRKVLGKINNRTINRIIKIIKEMLLTISLEEWEVSINHPQFHSIQILTRNQFSKQ